MKGLFKKATAVIICTLPFCLSACGLLWGSVNRNGSTTTSLQYAYCSNAAVFGVGNYSTLSPQVSASGGPFSISPTLPTGLTLNSTTGVISGTPSVVSAATAYTISSSASSTTINLQTVQGYVVNDSSDAAYSGPGCVSTDPGPNNCTLRAAVGAANASAPGTYNVILPSTTIYLGSPLVMNRSFGFFGTCPGPTIIDGQSLNQLFYANTNNLTVTMQLLTLQNSTATSGGAVWADFNANLTFNGTQVYFYKNFSTGGGGGGGALDWDTVNCTDCVFDSNQATNYGSAIQASNINLQRTLFINNTSGGHTIWIGTGGTSSIVNSTFYNNTGGGVYFNGPGTYSFLNDTFVDNSTTIAFDVGAIEGGGGSSFTVTNTLLYNNTGPWGACEGTLVDGGGNEVFPAVSGCTFIQASDIYVAPSLGSLQNNGGYSDTLATLPGSSGIDEALSGSCPTFDQRNYPRLTDGKCDIGAYESEP